MKTKRRPTYSIVQIPWDRMDIPKIQKPNTPTKKSAVRRPSYDIVIRPSNRTPNIYTQTGITKDTTPISPAPKTTTRLPTYSIVPIPSDRTPNTYTPTGYTKTNMPKSKLK